MRYALKRRLFTIYCLVIHFLLSPLPAEAVQVHGGAEGLIAHQIGHFLFFCGMIYLLIKVQNMGRKEKVWPEFRLFLWFIIAWNALTFVGHWLHEFVDPDKFVSNADGLVESFIVHDFSDAIFYLTRLDHLLLIPAFIFLLLALREWNRHER